MKIGILTLPLHTNYGGILQAYALQTVLERMGHEVVVIDKDRNIHRSVFRQIPTWGKYFLNKFLLRKQVRLYKPERENRERKEREQYTRAFIDKNIHTYLVKRLKKDVPKDFDAIIVGSDQIWRHWYFTMLYNSPIEDAYLKFAERMPLKRIAYAASFGTEDWEYSEVETKECSRLLSMFNAVSVRERSGISLCCEKLGRKGVKQVLDPTMLLTKNDYIHLVSNSITKQCGGNLMCYILDCTDAKIALVQRIAEERRLIPFFTNSHIDDPKAPQQDRIQPPVEQWLRGFVDSKFVITDSFHACVFSILLQKPFIVFGNKKRGMDRFTTLLDSFGLRQNLLLKSSDYRDNYDYSIGGNSLKTLNELKEESISFLKKSLSL